MEGIDFRPLFYLGIVVGVVVAVVFICLGVWLAGHIEIIWR